MGKKNEENGGNNLNDLILISIILVVFVCILFIGFLISKKLFPKIFGLISNILRQIFFNILITAFLKSYLRLSLSSCENSMQALAGDFFVID